MVLREGQGKDGKGVMEGEGNSPLLARRSGPVSRLGNGTQTCHDRIDRSPNRTARRLAELGKEGYAEGQEKGGGVGG